MSVGSQWLDEVREQLGPRSEAIRSALKDVAEWCGALPAIGWVDPQRDSVVTV